MKRQAGSGAAAVSRLAAGPGTIGYMPELPEVEALAVSLRERAAGLVIDRADPAEFSVLKTYDPALAALRGRAVTGAARYGKFLDLITSGPPGPGAASPGSASPGAASPGSAGPGSAGPGSAAVGPAGPDGPLHLVMHLARAGWLRWRDSLPEQPPRPSKSPLAFRLRFADGTGFDLTEAGTRKRLAVYLVTDPMAVPGIASLGPDPLGPGFTVAALAGLLAGRRTQIKGVLRDQKIIAGIGNAYSDEVLHAARMSPFRLASSLTPDDVAALHAVIIATLREAITRSDGLAAADLKKEKKAGLRVHGRTGQPCPVCGDTVREISFADSALQYCPTCQTGGKPLADRRMSRLLK
jgi:formamidopyrimidine-DNA glycosylase